MLKLFSKPKATTNIYADLKADMHSHLLPGIDDGATDIENSLDLIRGLKELGFNKLITTPHVMWDMYKNTRETILSKEEELQKAVSVAGLGVEIKAAAEYFLDDHVSSLIKNKEPLLTLSGNLVLVEFSLANPPLDLREQLFDLQMAGYQPVIAHPERYLYMHGRKDFYHELRDAGYFFQVNLLSFGNYYGRSVTDTANYLAKHGFYDYAGTDLHNSKYLDGLHNHSIQAPLKKLIDSGTLKNSEL